MAAKKITAAKPAGPTISYIGEEPAENPLFYINNVEISSSVFDIQIRLNRVVQIKDGTVFLKNQGTVAMSPQHAVSLLDLLQRTLKDYQEEHGPIPPSQIVDAETIE